MVNSLKNLTLHDFQTNDGGRPQQSTATVRMVLYVKQCIQERSLCKVAALMAYLIIRLRRLWMALATTFAFNDVMVMPACLLGQARRPGGTWCALAGWQCDVYYELSYTGTIA